MNISHIAIWVKDIENIKNFYVTYFNCKCNDKYINKKDINKLNKENNFYGFAHIAISVVSKYKVDSLTEELKNDGYIISSNPRTTGDGYYESVILDPENNKIELTI